MNIVIVIFVFVFNTVWAANTFTVQSTKESYPLKWETIYKVNICNAYSTVLEPPQGFVLEDVILGDSKLFKAEKSDNRAILKRLAPDAASTNLVLILSGPDKVSRSLTFELTGNEFPRISNVQFVLPEEKVKDPKLEAAKTFYTTQLQLTLMAQEKRLNNLVRENTLEKMETFQVEEYGPTLEKLGARIKLLAVMNSGGKGYVFLHTNAKDPEYQVVHLTGIQSKDLAKTVTLFKAVKLEDGIRYIYETTPFVKMDDGKKYSFFFRVYQERAEIKAKVK